MKPEALAKSQELADELKPDVKLAGELVSRWFALKDAKYVTADGDVITAKQMGDELEFLSKQLRPYIEEHGPITVEGKTLKLQPRADTKYDVIGMYERDRKEFDRWLSLGCFVGSSTIITAQKKAGTIISKGWEIPGQGTPALVIEKGQ